MAARRKKKAKKAPRARAARRRKNPPHPRNPFRVGDIVVVVDPIDELVTEGSVETDDCEFFIGERLVVDQIVGLEVGVVTIPPAPLVVGYIPYEALRLVDRPGARRRRNPSNVDVAYRKVEAYARKRWPGLDAQEIASQTMIAAVNAGAVNRWTFLRVVAERKAMRLHEQLHRRQDYLKRGGYVGEPTSREVDPAEAAIDPMENWSELARHHAKMALRKGTRASTAAYHRRKLLEELKRQGIELKPERMGKYTRAARASRQRQRYNPQTLLTLLKNPTTSAELKRAVAAATRFHGVPPKGIRQVKGDGPPLVALGNVVDVSYRPTRGDRKGPAFLHKFRAGAVLAASADGRELVIIPSRGRPFRVDWERGIVG